MSCRKRMSRLLKPCCDRHAQPRPEMTGEASGENAAYGPSIIRVIIAVLYFVLPGGSLPTFAGLRRRLDAVS